ncbi:Hypothetical predicted protein [Marmota monax]|uniref:Uncharacterized protein n=1 Tax=Marmota monax TaxID=9995 RepID=A0A5E4ACB9_MARMO|nr:Hypothetical predicted protein [Marmota monax]
MSHQAHWGVGGQPNGDFNDRKDQGYRCAGPGPGVLLLLGKQPALSHASGPRFLVWSLRTDRTSSGTQGSTLRSVDYSYRRTRGPSRKVREPVRSRISTDSSRAESRKRGRHGEVDEGREKRERSLVDTRSSSSGTRTPYWTLSSLTAASTVSFRVEDEGSVSGPRCLTPGLGPLGQRSGQDPEGDGHGVSGPPPHSTPTDAPRSDLLDPLSPVLPRPPGTPTPNSPRSPPSREDRGGGRTRLTEVCTDSDSVVPGPVHCSRGPLPAAELLPDARVSTGRGPPPVTEPSGIITRGLAGPLRPTRSHGGSRSPPLRSPGSVCGWGSLQYRSLSCRQVGQGDPERPETFVRPSRASRPPSTKGTVATLYPWPLALGHARPPGGPSPRWTGPGRQLEVEDVGAPVTGDKGSFSPRGPDSSGDRPCLRPVQLGHGNGHE